ncbi:MAG: AAA family ATPase [Pontibacterium sp.]
MKVFDAMSAKLNQPSEALAGQAGEGYLDGQTHASIKAALARLDNTILGKPLVVKKAFACLIAGGHLLFNDLPGLGKTTLSKALADSLGLSFKRVQFTSDLLPADLLGTNLYDPAKVSFNFRPGPVFSQVLLADEINRAPARTQSALLEAMAEQQVSVDGVSYPLDDDFSVIATQNPQEQAGAYALPESQLDRFMMCLQLGYPSFDSEMDMLKSGDTNISSGLSALDSSSSSASPLSLANLKTKVRGVYASDEVLAYAVRLVHATRSREMNLAYGVSPRGTKALVQAAKAWALIEGRLFVVPEDIQAVAADVFAHRLPIQHTQEAQSLVARLLEQVSVEQDKG